MVPQVGTVAAQPTFRLIAPMNPYDNVGTTRLSTSIHDRFNRPAVSYQDAPGDDRYPQCDTDLGRGLAGAGRGRMFRIRHHRDVAPALRAAFAS